MPLVRWGGTRLYSSFKHRVDCRQEDQEEAKKWCEENIKGDYGCARFNTSWPPTPRYMFVFDTSDDALMFKLSWG